MSVKIDDVLWASLRTEIMSKRSKAKLDTLRKLVLEIERSNLYEKKEPFGRRIWRRIMGHRIFHLHKVEMPDACTGLPVEAKESENVGQDKLEKQEQL